MASPYDKPSAGESFADKPPSAAAWCEMLDMLHWWKAGRNQPGGIRKQTEPYNSVIVHVKNTSDDPWLRGYVAVLSSNVFKPSDENDKAASPEDAFYEFPWFSAEAPTSGNASNRFVIVREAIQPGSIGKAVLVGVVACTVNMSNAKHKYAVPEADQVKRLKSSGTIGAEILWVSSEKKGTSESGTGEKKALVLLGVSATNSFWAKITSSEEIGAKHRWKYTFSRLGRTKLSDEDNDQDKRFDNWSGDTDSGYVAYNLWEVRYGATPLADGTSTVPENTIVRMYAEYLTETTTDNYGETVTKVTAEYWFNEPPLVRQELILDLRVNSDDGSFEKKVAKIYAIPGQDELTEDLDAPSEDEWIDWSTVYVCEGSP